MFSERGQTWRATQPALEIQVLDVRTRRHICLGKINFVAHAFQLVVVVCLCLCGGVILFAVDFAAELDVWSANVRVTKLDAE